uniref:Uncharacterized protein n=1 Tax=Strigamia maritima TaxID=126957 RepID=T1JNL0_STRMM
RPKQNGETAFFDRQLATS